MLYESERKAFECEICIFNAIDEFDDILLETKVNFYMSY